MYISTTIIFLLLFVGCDYQARTEIDKGWEHWTNGDIPQAHSVAENILKKTPADNEALHLHSLCLCVQGKYQEALAAFHLMDSAYAEYEEVGRAMVDAYIHLNEPENAFKLAKQLKLEYTDYHLKLAEKPFDCNANKTFIIPFNNDPNLQTPSKFFPSVTGKVNGKEVNIGFDTGAPFLVVGKEAAEKLGFALDFEARGMHGSTSVKGWRCIANEMDLGNGLVFNNVPVVIMESLGRMVIFGTNILEQFLATVDYPNSRFILTPRSRKDLYLAHLALLPKEKQIVPFYMWSDHYMFAKGSFNNIDGLNFFFDSGLVALTMIDGKLKQAPFTASKEKLISWGFDEDKLGKTKFLPTKFPLSVKGLTQGNTLIWYDTNLKKDMNFGGVRIDGLISHAFLSKYCWTIDFDKHQYLFGIY